METTNYLHFQADVSVQSDCRSIVGIDVKHRSCDPAIPEMLIAGEG
jgi:hypothetical protein